MRRRLRYSSFLLAFCFLSLQLVTAADTPKEKAWSVLYAGLSDSSYEKRTTAMQVLGLLPGDPKAEEAALKGLGDQRQEVRAAAAKALGDMKAKNATPKLMDMYNDKDPGVIMAAGKERVIAYATCMLPSSYRDRFFRLSADDGGVLCAVTDARV